MQVTTNITTSTVKTGFTSSVLLVETNDPITTIKLMTMITLMISKARSLILPKRITMRSSPGTENSALAFLEIIEEKNLARSVLNRAPTACHAAVASLARTLSLAKGDRASSCLVGISERVWEDACGSRISTLPELPGSQYGIQLGCQILDWLSSLRAGGIGGSKKAAQQRRDFREKFSVRELTGMRLFRPKKSSQGSVKVEILPEIGDLTWPLLPEEEPCANFTKRESVHLLGIANPTTLVLRGTHLLCEMPLLRGHPVVGGTPELNGITFHGSETSATEVVHLGEKSLSLLKQEDILRLNIGVYDVWSARLIR